MICFVRCRTAGPATTFDEPSEQHQRVLVVVAARQCGCSGSKRVASAQRMTFEPEFGHVYRPSEFVSVVSVIGMYETAVYTQYMSQR